MKKKLFVVIIAIALVATIVGTAFAVFVKNDTRHASVGYDTESVVLVINDGVSSTELSNNFVLDSIKPGETITKQINLATVNNVDKIQNGAEGIFIVTLTASETGDAEKNAALLSEVSFSATDSNSTVYNSAALASGVKISLLTIPEYFTLSISLPTEELGEYDFMDIAEASLAINIQWNKVDFAIDDEAYYIVGKVNGSETIWEPTINSYKLGAGNEENRAIGTYHFEAEDQFYLRNADNSEYANGQGSNYQADVFYADNGGNVHIQQSGTYTVYWNNSDQIWVELVELDD